MIAKIATGELENAPENDGKSPAAKALGRKGGAARAGKMTLDRQSQNGPRRCSTPSMLQGVFKSPFVAAAPQPAA